MRVSASGPGKRSEHLRRRDVADRDGVRLAGADAGETRRSGRRPARTAGVGRDRRQPSSRGLPRLGSPPGNGGRVAITEPPFEAPVGRPSTHVPIVKPHRSWSSSVKAGSRFVDVEFRAGGTRLAALQKPGVDAARRLVVHAVPLGGGSVDDTRARNDLPSTDIVQKIAWASPGEPRVAGNDLVDRGERDELSDRATNARGPDELGALRAVVLQLAEEGRLPVRDVEGVDVVDACRARRFHEHECGGGERRDLARVDGPPLLVPAARATAARTAGAARAAPWWSFVVVVQAARPGERDRRESRGKRTCASHARPILRAAVPTRAMALRRAGCRPERANAK